MKKRIFKIALMLSLVASVFIPSVQARAISTLSVFRVGDTKTITITMLDMEEIAAYFSNHRELRQQLHDNGLSLGLSSFETTKLSHHGRVDDISLFTAFPVRLPRVLQDETPEIHATSAMVAELILDIPAKNNILYQLGDAPLFDVGLNGASIQINTPPVLLMDFIDAEILIAATQMPYVVADRWVKESLRATMLDMPFVPHNLRMQLANIPVDTRDVYLPVVMGFGRAVSIGDSTGYVYTLSDLTAVFQQIGTLNAASAAYDVSVLVWAQDGVLYFVAGDKTDSELASIARSMR